MKLSACWIVLLTLVFMGTDYLDAQTDGGEWQQSPDYDALISAFPTETLDAAIQVRPGVLDLAAIF